MADSSTVGLGEYTPAPGSYLLYLTTGGSSSQTTSFDVTIGAVGPQGPVGPTGVTGATGSQGPAGPAGAVSRAVAVSMASPARKGTSAGGGARDHAGREHASK